MVAKLLINKFKSISLLFIIFLLSVLGYLYMQRQKDQKAGTIIILNGPSGSGKSSIQKAFQQIMMPNLWLKTGIDDLFDRVMPDITSENLEYWQSPNPIRWVESTKDKDGKPVITLFVGEQAQQVAYAMNSAIAAYAQNGCNLIVDYIAYDQAWLKDLQEKLKDIKTYYIKVDISLDLLEQREAARGTSPQGHARSHYHTVYGDLKYDLVVNSEHDKPEQIAEKIKYFIEKKN